MMLRRPYVGPSILRRPERYRFGGERGEVVLGCIYLTNVYYFRLGCLTAFLVKSFTKCLLPPPPHNRAVRPRLGGLLPLPSLPRRRGGQEPRGGASRADSIAEGGLG
jgi:hypothetical protein